MDAQPDLIKLPDSDEPYIKASDLAKWLEYKSVDNVSQIVRRRPEDFQPRECVVDESGRMLVNYDGALKLCMFSQQPRAREVRDQLILIYRSWREGSLPSFQHVSSTEQALGIARCVVRLAEDQLRHEQILQQQEQKIVTIDQRLSRVEAIQNKGFITDAQCSQITVRVREIGQIISGARGKNLYGRVYTSLYERFGVSSYKNIPSDLFEQVMAWLNQTKSQILNDVQAKQ